MNFSQQSLSDGNPTYRRGHERFKVIGDPIHHMITVDDAVLQVIDTPEFQRLRDLKQLGTAYYVFPGASHNRFEHSIGVSHLSGQMIDFLAASTPSLGVTEEERMYIKIAGAVHDLGHGPFR
jgi:HD superfamily phosphohydrolase